MPCRWRKRCNSPTAKLPGAGTVRRLAAPPLQPHNANLTALYVSSPYPSCVPAQRNVVKKTGFTPTPSLPYQLRLIDFESAMQDVYDFFYDVNLHLGAKGLQRLDDMLRPAICSGTISDMLTASLAKHSRALKENRYFNGHPDLVVQGVYANDAVKAGEEGVEVKSTRKIGGAVDTHGARRQWLCVFVYNVDNKTEPASDRAPMAFSEVYLGQVTEEDFRRNERGPLGTRTATLDRDGIAKLRRCWVYLDRKVNPEPLL